MWEPQLRRDLEHCTVVDSQVIDGRTSVFCILDPPRYAVGEAAYKTAQRNAGLLFNNLPHESIALQDDFWDDYRNHGSLGISVAIRKSEKAPMVFPLEHAFPRLQFEELKNRAVDRMRLATPFFTSIISAFDALAARASAPFATIKRLYDDYHHQKTTLGHHEKTTLGSYLDQLMAQATSLGQSVPMEIILAGKDSELTDRLRNDVLQWEKQKLEEDITSRAKAHAFSARTALQIYLYLLQLRHRREADYGETIEACRTLLQEPHPPVDDGIVRQVADAVCDELGEFIGMGVRVDPESQHLPYNEGEVISRLVELAPLFDIDMNRYPTLQLCVRRSHISHHLATRRAAGLVMGIGEALRRLEIDLFVAAAGNGPERELVALMPVMETLSELRLFRIGYGDEARAALAVFRAADLCHELEALGAAISPPMHAEAVKVDGWMREVIELGEETVRRGKLLAGALLREIEQRKLTSTLLVCDAYLYDVVAGEFGDAVSYSLLMPDF